MATGNYFLTNMYSPYNDTYLIEDCMRTQSVRN